MMITTSKTQPQPGTSARRWGTTLATGVAATVLSLAVPGTALAGTVAQPSAEPAAGSATAPADAQHGFQYHSTLPTGPRCNDRGQQGLMQHTWLAYDCEYNEGQNTFTLYVDYPPHPA